MRSPPPEEDPPGFLPQGGNYRELLSYRKAETLFDFTFRFCERFLKRGDRTQNQMVQSAQPHPVAVPTPTADFINDTLQNLPLLPMLGSLKNELLTPVRSQPALEGSRVHVD